jgi:hypothetical protein
MAGGANHSPRATRLKNKDFHKRQRGDEIKSRVTRETGTSIGPLVVGFFLFVVVGSAFLQIIRTAQTATPPGQ